MKENSTDKDRVSINNILMACEVCLLNLAGSVTADALSQRSGEWTQDVNDPSTYDNQVDCRLQGMCADLDVKATQGWRKVCCLCFALQSRLGAAQWILWVYSQPPLDLYKLPVLLLQWPSFLNACFRSAHATNPLGPFGRTHAPCLNHV